MAYTEFTVESVRADLGVTVEARPLFPGLAPVAAPPWLIDSLGWGREVGLLSEKARSEFIVAPILLAVRLLTGRAVSILSGHKLEADAARKLSGECDFLLARAAPAPFLNSPLLALVEAKKNDLDSGLGQVIAQMVGAQIVNRRAPQPEAERPVYGCVTTGEAWQFLRLDGAAVVMDADRYYINQLELILAAILATVA